MAQIGQVIDGKFRIVKMIGRGGMSRVYLARDVHLDKKWVVKEIPRFVNGKENTFLVEAALSEADIIKSLDHPAIVRIVDIARDRSFVYIVEDYVQGISLKEYTDRCKDVSAIEEPVLKDWAIQLCRVLIYLHGRRPPVIFRDIKPENVILTPSGHLKLVDFGIARRYRPDKSRDTVYLGTEMYAAPEQYEESGLQTDMRTDIYGFGKTLQYLSRFCGNGQAGSSGGLSEALRGIIRKCIRQNPDERYQDAQELLEELETYEERQKRLFSRRQRRRWLAVGAVLFLVLGAVCLLDPSILGPDQKASLQELIGTIREQKMFTQEDEEALLNLLLPHLQEWKEEEDFEQTAFDIGMLYRDYYLYGPDHIAGEIASVPWFVLARRVDPSAQVYELIGKTREMLLDMQPVPLEQLRSMLGLVQDEAAGQELLSEVCVLTADALASGMERFQTEGKKADVIQNLLERLVSLRDRMEMMDGSDEWEEEKKNVSDHLAFAQEAADRVYGSTT